MLLAPTRVMVRSAKVSSARESAPVWTALPSMTLSFKCAGRAATCGANRLTSRTTRVTRACFRSAAVNGKITAELKSSNNPARDNERLKIDFTVVSEFRRKRKSATDISDTIEVAVSPNQSTIIPCASYVPGVNSFFSYKPKPQTDFQHGQALKKSCELLLSS